MGPLFSRSDVEIIMQCFQLESLKSVYNPATHQAELRQHVAKVLKIKEIFTNTIPREGISLNLSSEYILGNDIDQISSHESNEVKEKEAPLHTNCYYCADYEIKFTVL